MAVTLEKFVSLHPLPPPEFENQLSPLSVADVVGTYFFDSMADVCDDLTRFEWTTDGDELGWNVWFFENTGECMNELGESGAVLPLMRKLHASVQLRGEIDVSGRAGHNRLICLKEKYRRRGIGGTLDSRERELFQRWEAQELHLEAGCQALREGTWLRLGYKPALTERLALQELWRDYQELDCHVPAPKIPPCPDSWANWPKGFRDIVCAWPAPMPLYVEL